MEKVKNERYDFSKEPLADEFPAYMHKAIESWVTRVFEYGHFFVNEYSGSRTHLKQGVINSLELRIRRVLPNRTEDFLNVFLAEKDNTIFLLNLLLDNFGNELDDDVYFGEELERTLSLGGSAYTAKDLNGKWGLYYRVDKMVEESSEQAIKRNDYLKTAWAFCYGVNPDYNKVVIESVNCLEDILKTHYLPKNQSPKLGQLIKDIEAQKADLEFCGAEILDEKGREVLKLLKNLVRYRGMHKSGNGQDATKEIAIYALHTTIWLWNLHEQK